MLRAVPQNWLAGRLLHNMAVQSVLQLELQVTIHLSSACRLQTGVQGGEGQACYPLRNET